VLYVLDEPSIGLHARDNDRLIETLLSLRDKGNTVLVVEHDNDVMARADRIIDLGPGAGIHGGTILANETPAGIKQNTASLTGLFLAKGINHPISGAYRPLVAEVADPGRKKPRSATRATANPDWLELTGIHFRNLKDVSLRLPLGRLTMVCGPSGAGKSTLFRDILHPAVSTAIKAKKSKLSGKDFVRLAKFDGDGGAATPPRLDARGRGRPRSNPEPFAELRSANGFRTVVEVDQSPIGKTPRSTPATYLGIFDLIRQFFASLPEAKMRGYTAVALLLQRRRRPLRNLRRRRPHQARDGLHADTYLPCDDLPRVALQRPNSPTSPGRARPSARCCSSPSRRRRYSSISTRSSRRSASSWSIAASATSRSARVPSLSGGEAQRLKLVTELSAGLATYQERSRGIAVRNLYLLEEPTIGLHLSDCEKLIRVLHSLVEQGHTVVVIEHHLDLLAEADYIIELGPVGGPTGGKMLYQGPLAGLLKVKQKPDRALPA
jgi:excinuclease ABC subunit A